MRPRRKYYLPLPSGAQLIVQAENKMEAVDQLEKMGHQVGCCDLKPVKKDIEDIKKRHGSEP